MLKRLAGTILFLILAASPLAASDLSPMTDAERQALRDEIRAYLLEHPEVLVEAINVLEERQARAQVQSDADLIAASARQLFEDPLSYVGGNPDGDVTMVEFLDYRCGFCKKAHPEVAALLKSDGNIRYIIKEFPILGEESTLAARFAIATKLTAGDAAYFAVSNALMAQTARVTEGGLRRLARAQGLDPDAIFAGMEDARIDQAIQANYRLAQALAITGTPGFVMGDTMLRGYAPLETMQKVISEQRTR